VNPVIEFRARHTGDVLTKMPLHEFLRVLHTQSPAADEFAFEDLTILLDGEEVLPSACGHA
jgi:hypothetical protein